MTNRKVAILIISKILSTSIHAGTQTQYTSSNIKEQSTKTSCNHSFCSTIDDYGYTPQSSYEYTPRENSIQSIHKRTNAFDLTYRDQTEIFLMNNDEPLIELIDIDLD